jgi:hypothetical protein
MELAFDPDAPNIPVPVFVTGQARYSAASE